MKKYETFYKLTNDDVAFLTKEDKQISAVSELNEEKARLNALIKEQERLKAKIELLEKEKRDEHAEKEQIAEIEPAKTFSVIEMLKADKLMLFLLIGFFLMASVLTAYVNGFLYDSFNGDQGVTFFLALLVIWLIYLADKKKTKDTVLFALVGLFGILVITFVIYYFEIIDDTIMEIFFEIFFAIGLIAVIGLVLSPFRKMQKQAIIYLITGLLSFAYCVLIMTDNSVLFAVDVSVLLVLILYVFEKRSVTRLVTTVVVGVTALSLFTIRPVIYTALINNKLYYYMKYGDIDIYSYYEEYVRVNSLLLLGFTFIMLIINIYQYYKQTHPRTP